MLGRIFQGAAITASAATVRYGRTAEADDTVLYGVHAYASTTRFRISFARTTIDDRYGIRLMRRNLKVADWLRARPKLRFGSHSVVPRGVAEVVVRAERTL